MKMNFLLMILIIPTLINGQSTSTYRSASVATGKTIETETPASPGEANGEEVSQEPEVQVPEFVTDTHTHFFPNPGVVGNVNGEWEGTDHLLNVPGGIEVYVELLGFEDEPVQQYQNDVYKVLADIFSNGNLIPQSKESNPPLPFFHMLVMKAKVEDKLVIFVEGRLFESVTLERFNLEQGTNFQAITWERQSLNTISATQLKSDLEKFVAQIGNDFVERYRFFDHLKMQKKDN